MENSFKRTDGSIQGYEIVDDNTVNIIRNLVISYTVEDLKNLRQKLENNIKTYKNILEGIETNERKIQKQYNSKIEDFKKTIKQIKEAKKEHLERKEDKGYLQELFEEITKSYDQELKRIKNAMKMEQTNEVKGMVMNQKAKYDYNNDELKNNESLLELVNEVLSKFEDKNE